MHESGYYPPGAEFDPRAPWNEETQPERAFDVEVEVTLRRDAEVLTTCYEELWERDDDGRAVSEVTVARDELERAYVESTHSITDLLAELKGYIERELDALRRSEEREPRGLPSPRANSARRLKLRRMLDDLAGWTVDDTYVSLS